MIAHLVKRLSDYRAKQLYRYRQPRSNHSELINFSCNDYLGLSQHPDVIKAFQQSAEQYGVGSGASQLVTGHTKLHQECEVAFADFLQRDRALLFGNGYMANLGVIDALTDIGDYIYQDRHNHASLLDAGRLSKAKSQRYAHKNMNDLTQRLSKSQNGKKLIVTDGVFSMHGDITPLTALVELSHEHQANLMVDDAHGIGILGSQGRGSLALANLSQKDVAILVCSLGKAFGVYGAIVAGSDALIESCIQFSRSYIYTTALPPALAGAALKSLEVMQNESWRREKLQSLIGYFQKLAKERELRLFQSESAIQAIAMDSASHALMLSQQLQQQGYWVYPMRPPSVPHKKSMLRITLNALHTEQQIRQLLDAMV